MARIYEPIGPSSNKAATPGQEKKGDVKPPAQQPPKSGDKKD